jgi:hypothetical protein
MDESPTNESGGGRNPWKIGVLSVLALLLLGGIVTGVVLLVGSSNEAAGQTIQFQQSDEVGADPFTPATDVAGDTEVRLASSASSETSDGGVPAEPSSGAGTFGGSGSNTVCDREKLIRELLARPDRMRAWAGVLGVDPTARAVARYIRGLRPVTLTRDTQVTNHAYRNGQIVSFQSILEAGTAVLVDKYGKPVVRCRCGNPLTEPVFYTKARCLDCPPHYRYPPPCRWRPYDPYDKLFGRDPYTGDYLERPPTVVVYKSKNPYSTCYVFYPSPPKTLFKRLARPASVAPPPPPPPQSQPYTAPHTYTQPYTPTCENDPYSGAGCDSTTPSDGCCGGMDHTHTDTTGSGIDCSDPNTYCNSYP